MSSDSALPWIAIAGLVGHQVFKRHETFSIAVHVSVLCIPPLLGATLLLRTLPPLWALVLSASTYLTSLIFATAVYRLSPFHPLAKYPGPVWCKLSKLWVALISLGGRQHLYIQALHERYGDVVRTGPNEVSIRDPSVIPSLLGSNGLPHGPMYVGKVLNLDPPIVGIMDTDKHLERRKPWARAFSAASLKEYEPIVAARAHQLVQALERQRGEVDIGKWVNYFSYDFMYDLTFGGGSELMRDDGHATMNFWSMLEAGLPPGTFLSHVPLLAPYAMLIPAVSADIEKVLAYSKDLAASRLARGSQVKDLFHHLNNEDRPSLPPPPARQLVDESVIAMVAGTDTVSSALTSIFFCLATHPKAYTTLQQEIDQFYPPGQDPCETKHYSEMPYLAAVINEALRVLPPVPSGSQRQVPRSSNGATIGSLFLPPGTIVTLHTYSVYRDPRNFSPRPDDFWPERWLIAAGKISFGSAGAVDEGSGFVHNEAAFVPFSYGPMNCVGKNLAMLEMRVVVCAVLQKFEMRVREGWNAQEFEEGFKDFFVTTRPPVPVILNPRF